MVILKTANHREILRSAGLFLLILITYQIYSPGINGVFIFDDIPNLSPLGRYKELSLWDNFRLFILEGSAGPTGRPLSLASFYLNDTNWPSQPSGFIKTNILIHLLNGTLIFWLTLKLSSSLKLVKARQITLSIFATAFWLLHPMQTTTVLYIIQRMTELSALFMLTGLIFYLYGREKLFGSLRTGFLILFLGVGISLLLSILSKENGILLVAYILVIEFFLFRPLNCIPPQHFNYWLVPTVIIPFIAIIIYLGLNTNPDNFENRNFTLAERLLTEPRILFDYLHHIIIPDMGDITLFHDDYIISKDLLTPWTTFLSIVGLLILVSLAFILQNKKPVIAFAIAWFLAGHLIESTVLPLELYFEHRNYLPLLGIGISCAWYATKYLPSNKTVIYLLFGSLISLNTCIVYQNTTLWGQPLELTINWYKAHPQSIRTRQLYRYITKLYGIKPDLLSKQQTTSTQKSMLYVTTVIRHLADTCLSNGITPEMLDSAFQAVKDHNVHSTTGQALMDFFSNWEAGNCNTIQQKDMEKFLNRLASAEKVKKISVLAHNVHFSLALLFRKKRDLNNTMIHLDKAYHYHPTFDMLQLRAATVASAGLYNKAIEILNDTSLLEKTIRERLALKIQLKELNELKNLFSKEIQPFSFRK